jgi:RNA polymerase sigma-70 factor (ECF subfamily)
VDDLTPLLLAVAEGDRAALEDLVVAGQADVWRFCAAIVGPSFADDATQETFVRAWRAARTFRGEASARTWLLAIARRASYDQVRRQRHHEPLGDDRPAGGGDASAAFDLHDLVQRLEPDRRAAFVLTQLHGLSYSETAEVCSCPVGTVRSRVARARADLLAAYAADAGTDAGRSDGNP